MRDGALVGYARVSTIDQDHSTQIDRLKAAGCQKVFCEKKSGTSKKGRAALSECLEYLREGDTLVFTKIDRLARSARDLHNLVYDLRERGISVMSLDQAIDTSTTHGTAFLGMLAVFAEFETCIRKERQMEGIAKAKQEGKYKGRKPTAMMRKTEIQALAEQGMTKPAIAAQLGVSVSSVYNAIRA